MAAAAISFASRIRSISCAVLIARAAFRTGMASAAPGHASNQAFVNVVGSPTIRSDACVPIESSRPTRPSEAASAASSVRAGTGRGSSLA